LNRKKSVRQASESTRAFLKVSIVVVGPAGADAVRRGNAGEGEEVLVVHGAGVKRQYSTMDALAVDQGSSADWERVGV
jgi:hypothetical protein